MKKIAVMLACALIVMTGCNTTKPVTTTVQPKETQAERNIRLLEAVYASTEAGDYGKAQEIMSQLIDENPKEYKFMVLRGALYISMHDFPSAIASAEAVLASDPENTDALLLIAKVLLFQNKTSESQKYLQRILDKNPSNVFALTTMGDIALGNQNYSLAESYYNKAVAADPREGAALAGLARIQFKRGQTKEALESFNKAILLDPSDASALLDRSRVLYDLGRYEDCEADLNASIALDNSNFWSFIERGRLYLDSGRNDEALKDLSRAIELNPSYFLAYIYRAAIYENKGQDQEAYNDYAKAVEMKEEYWYALESMAVLAYRLQAWDKAYAAFHKATNYTTNHPEYYVAAALSLLRSGDKVKAKDYASKYLPKIDKEKFYPYWLLLRYVVDQATNTSELELKIATEKSLDARAGLLFYLSQYWMGLGHTEMAARSLEMVRESNRQGTIEWRMAEADWKRISK